MNTAGKPRLAASVDPSSGPTALPTAVALLVTPPDETTQLRVVPPPEVCGQKTLTVGPLTAPPLPD